MANLLQAIVTGAITFGATNIDDIFVLILFFGQKDKFLKAWHVVAGQYLGFTALVSISLVGYFARYVAPREWIGVLGLLPITIGVKKLIDWREGNRAHAEPEVKRASRRASSMLTVAAVTIANGADNIGIYTPLFAAINFGRLVVTLSVFFVLVGVWCVAGYYLGGHLLVVKTLDRYGHIIVPFVLIGLGVFIMYESGTLALVGRVG